MQNSKYVFNPLEHGFEPIQNYPELKFNYPMIDGYFVKIIAYDDFGGLVYWYMVISTHVGMPNDDDRVEIKSGSYDFRQPCTYEAQSKRRTVYLGLIGSDAFAKELLLHLLGTTNNESLQIVSIERYKESIGAKMRSEYPQHYKPI